MTGTLNGRETRTKVEKLQTPRKSEVQSGEDMTNGAGRRKYALVRPFRRSALVPSAFLGVWSFLTFRRSFPVAPLLALIVASETTGCRTVPPSVATDADLGRLATAARKVFDMGEPGRAVPLYREALRRARALNDDAAVGAVGANLAACLLDTGAYDAAREAVREARDGLRRAGRPEADAAILEGRIARAQGRADEARSLTASLAAMPAPSRTSRAAAALLAADIALDADAAATARTAVDEAVRWLRPGDAPALLAWQSETQARLYAASGAHTKAAAAFEEAARLRGRASQANRVTANLRAAADAHAIAGSRGGEADCLYRAARALAGAGRSTEALPLLDRAARCAADAPETAGLRELIAALKAELTPVRAAP